DLMQRRPASAGLERDVLFWHAEALARLGRSDDAAREFVRFAQPGLHPLLVTSLLRQGWALRDAGKPAEAATVFRTYLGAPASPESSASERDWAELGPVALRGRALGRCGSAEVRAKHRGGLGRLAGIAQRPSLPEQARDEQRVQPGLREAHELARRIVRTAEPGEGLGVPEEDVALETRRGRPALHQI